MFCKIDKNKGHFWEKVAFAKHINKIKKSFIRDYFLSLFKYKNLIFKAILFIGLSIIIIGSGFGTEFWFINNSPEQIVLNPGVGFSFGKNFEPWKVYLIQSIPIVLSGLFFIFVPTWWLTIGFLMMFFGGMCNIIDRKLDFIINDEHSVDKVVDYIKLINTTANVNDIWICIGVGVIVLTTLLNIIFMLKKDDSNSNESSSNYQNEIELNSKNSSNNNFQ